MIALVVVGASFSRTAAASAAISGRENSPITIAENAFQERASELELKSSIAVLHNLLKISTGLTKLLLSFGPRLDLLDKVVVSARS